jgi:hypothetical protein
VAVCLRVVWAVAEWAVWAAWIIKPTSGLAN